MGILDLFRKDKDEVHGAKALVCASDNRFDGLLKGDSEVYGRYYRATTAAVLPNIQSLLGRLEQRYDIVHLLCDVTANGTITDVDGEEITGTELIQRCCNQNVKLFWSGSDNPPERYIKGFGARGKRLNLVMTLKRKGPNFPDFSRNYYRKWLAGTPFLSLETIFAHRFPAQIIQMRRNLFSLQGVAA
jgi:hypothetical protein